MIAILHKIRSAHNVGSIFRTADSAGIKKLYLCGFTPSPLDRFGNYRVSISKVALGAERTVDWEKKQSTLRTLNYLRKKGYLIIAIEQSEKSIEYTKMPLKKLKKAYPKIAFVIGHELEGVPKEILSKCDIVSEIKMFGDKASLNVSVAFGVVSMYVASIIK